MSTRPEDEAAERWMSLSRHPNVRARYYADAEQVDGGPLRIDAVSTIDQALDIAIQAARGLEHAHRHDVAHGAVGPDAVLVTPDGTVKITGFGVPAAAAWQADVTAVRRLVRELGGPALPDGLRMADVIDRLTGTYRQECGRPYPRPAPVPLTRTSDELTDHGIMLTVLGRVDAAQSLFDQALAVHPGHPEATYHSGLLRWRTGELTDDRLLAALDSDHLRALVHLERGDAAAALPLLLRTAKDTDAFRYAVQAERPHRLQPRTVQVRPGIRSDSLHAGPGRQVDHVRLSADGRIAATAGNETVQVWDTRTGRCLQEAHEHTATATALHLTPDGGHVLSGTGDGTVSWRTAEDGRLRRRLETGDRVVDIWTDPEARTAVITVRSGLQVWDLHAGRLLRVIDPGGPIIGAGVSADGTRAVSSGLDRVLRLWDLRTGECLAHLEGHRSLVGVIRLSADGRVAVSAGQFDPVLRVWDLDSGQCRHRLTGHVREARGLDVSADGRYAVSAGGTDHTVRLWDLRIGRCQRTFTSDYDDTAALSADGRTAAAGGLSGVVRVWDIPAPTGYAAPPQPCVPRSYAAIVVINAEADTLLDRAERAIAEEDFGTAHALLVRLRTDRRHDRTPRALRAWQRLSARIDRVAVEDVLVTRTLHGHTDRVESICAVPGSRTAISGGRDGTLRIWDLESGACLRTLTGHTGSVLSVTTDGTGRTIVSAGRDKTIRVWDAESGACVRTLTGQGSVVYSVAVSADGRRAVSSARDGDRLLVWDLTTGTRLRRLDGHTGGVPTVAITPDGRLAVSGSHDGTARVWDPDTGDCVRVLDPEEVEVVRLSADGGSVLTVDSDGRAGLWDLASGDRLRAFEPPDWSHLADVQLSHDGRYAVAAGDHLLSLHDLATGDPLFEPADRPDAITAACLSPDGRFLVAACRDTTVRVWELTWDLRLR
ncbi:putative WD repeat-containing protein [Actinoplanes sp. SE50]|uniref:hypothetical protein n=1 Tax=unclassified Actinoplanes TaxID=2626549 RepID=UPI00023EC4F1|nr:MULTISPECIES: hypothetical protein [unclassified Actinoplanes]AEV87014.1 putative WD repeat-containing protein [Actinoplanes sp. SE50/110]ATO85412.1 putative WD repeat-containing protein [Actinoplanes sp. SE50]SLM02824.1 hypothetical protein ACSP50_6109 [Actinoplanes sp. SE50/110]